MDDVRMIAVPDGVTVSVDKLAVTVAGPNGSLTRDFGDPRFAGLFTITQDNGLAVATTSEKRKVRAMTGTVAAHLANMVTGVTKGFTYRMKILYTHFPMTVEVKESEVHIKNFLGEKGVRAVQIRGDAKVTATKESVAIEGANLEDVSQTAANIEMACTIGRRDRRVFQDGIYIEARE